MQWRFTGPAPFRLLHTISTHRHSRPETPCREQHLEKFLALHPTYNITRTVRFGLSSPSTTRRETWANQDNKQNSSGEFHLASNLSFYDPNPFVSRMSILLLFQVTADPTTKRVQQNLLWKNYWYGTILLFIGSVHSTFHYPRRIFAGSSPLSCVIEEK